MSFRHADESVPDHNLVGTAQSRQGPSYTSQGCVEEFHLREKRQLTERLSNKHLLDYLGAIFVLLSLVSDQMSGTGPELGMRYGTNRIG